MNIICAKPQTKVMPEKILFNNYLKMEGKERKAENFN
jgi:hypothetical protein